MCSKLPSPKARVCQVSEDAGALSDVFSCAEGLTLV
jgi:hypothetical protein